MATPVGAPPIPFIAGKPFGLDLLALIPFQENGRWILFIPEFPHMTLYVENCSVPQYQFETDPITKAIVNFKDVGEVTIGFREDKNGTVQQVLNLWESQIWDRRSRVFRDNQLLPKKTAALILDDLVIGVPTIAYRFEEMVYRGINDLQFSQSDSDAMKLTALFSVRFIFPMYALNGFGSTPYP